MSASRRARERNVQPKGETYSRADEALWDDEYLLKLFNEQLENSTAVSEAARKVDIVSNTSSASDAATDEDSPSTSSASRSATTSHSSAEHKKEETQRPAVTGAVAANAFTFHRLPEDVRELVQSFYNAGFEAGRFAARSEVVAQKSRKRHR